VAGAARDLVDDAMANAPLAVEEALRLVDEGMDASLDTAMRYEQAVTAYLYTTEDNAEDPGVHGGPGPRVPGPVIHRVTGWRARAEPGSVPRNSKRF